jgi:3-hydroxymyristoyl/3-hydroxydecanoyl-(acyl carrier protein) dehydratase
MMMSDEAPDVADIEENRRLLPHRYPFLLVDRIIDIRGADYGIGIKNVTMNEPQFGHSENPFMPGVLVIEGLAQTAAALTLRMGPPTERPRNLFFLTINKARFRKPCASWRHAGISCRKTRPTPQHVLVSLRGEGPRRFGCRSGAGAYLEPTAD